MQYVCAFHPDFRYQSTTRRTKRVEKRYLPTKRRRPRVQSKTLKTTNVTVMSYLMVGLVRKKAGMTAIVLIGLRIDFIFFMNKKTHDFLMLSFVRILIFARQHNNLYSHEVFLSYLRPFSFI